MGVRKEYFFLGFCFFVQLGSGVPIDEASRTSIFSNAHANFINSANQLTSSSLENHLKSSGNHGASINSIGSDGFGSSAKSFNDKLSQSFKKYKPSPSQGSVASSEISTLNSGISSSNSVNRLTDATSSSFNPASLVSSRSLSNSGRSLFNSPLRSANQASSILATSSGSSGTTGSLGENPLLDSVSDINYLSPGTQSFGSSTLNNDFPLSPRFSSQSSRKRETDMESTTLFSDNFNIKTIRGTPMLRLEGISQPYSVGEDSSSKVSLPSAASNSNGISANSLAESSFFSENAISTANVLNSNSLNNRKPFNSFGQFSYPIISSIQNDAIAQSLSENSASVSTANNNFNGNGLRNNNLAGFTNSLGQFNANGFSSEKNAVSGANNFINNNVLNNNFVSDSVSSIAQQSPFSGVPQSSITISNAQTTTPSPVGLTNFNSNQGFSYLTYPANSVSNDVSTPNNNFATFLNQGTNSQYANQQSVNLQNILSVTQSASLPALSSTSTGTQTQSFSPFPQVSSQSINPVNSVSFASDSSSINTAITNSAVTENNPVSVQPNSVNLSPNSQAFSQNIFTNAQPASIGSNGPPFGPFGAVSENIASQLNLPSQFSKPSNVQSVSSYTSDGLSTSTSTQSPFGLNNAPSYSPANNQGSFNILPGTLNLQSISTESFLATNNPSFPSVNNQASFNILPNILNLQSTSTESSFSSNNPSLTSFNNQSPFYLSPNALNLQSASTESSFASNNPSFSSVNNQASFNTLPNTLNLQPMSSINAFAGSLANSIQPALSLADTQVTQLLNNGVATTREEISFGNGNSALNPSGVGISQFTSGLQTLPSSQFINLPSSLNNPLASSLNNPLASNNPDQGYNSLSSGSLSNVLSNTQPGSAYVTDNSINTVAATTSAGNPFGISSLNSNIAESSASITSLANGFGINSQSPLVSQNQITENSVSTIATQSSANPSNSIGLSAFNNNPTSINSLGKGFNVNSPSPIESSNTVIENSLNSVSNPSSQNRFSFLPYNSNTADSSVSINSLGSGVSNNAQSFTLSSTGSVPSSNTFASASINSNKDSVSNQPYYNIPLSSARNQAFNIPNIQLVNSHPSNNALYQNEAFAEQVQNVNLQPISQLTAPFNQLSTLTPPIVNSNYLLPLSNFASSNSISAPSSSAYPTDLGYTTPAVTSLNQGNAVAVSDSLSSQQLSFNSDNSLSSRLALPPSDWSNALSSPSSIVISPGFTQTSLPNPVLAAPSYLPPIFVGNSRRTDSVDNFIELIVLSELFNGIDCNSNFINNPWLAFLLSSL